MRRLLFILILIASNSYSQDGEKDSIFLDASWNVTKYRSLAKYYRKIHVNDSNSILTVRDYYLENGNLQMIGTYHKEMKRSNQTGEFKYFYPDGKIKAIYEYKDGLIDGSLQKYYKSGKIKSKQQYDLGTQIDTITTYFEDGSIHKISILNKDYDRDNPSYKYCKEILYKAFSKDGETIIDEGNGVLTEYFLSGKKRTEIEYENGLPHGKWIKYTGKKKKKSAIMTFKEGKFIKGEIYDNGKKDVFSSLSRKAYFPSGLRGLDKYLNDNLGNCNDIKDNELLLMVSIGTDGKVYFEQLISGDVGPCQLEELQTLVKNMPLWAPAIENGHYVEGNQAIRVRYKKMAPSAK